MKIFNVYNRIIEAFGLIYGIANIEKTLGIIVLAVSIVSMIINLIDKIRVMLKDGKIEKEEIDELIETIQKETQEIESKFKKDREQ